MTSLALLLQHLSTSAPLTIELITTDVARIITAPPPPSLEPATWDVPRATVRIAKPVALMFAKHPSVQVTRSRTDFLQRSIPSRRFSTSSRAVNVTPHTAFLGLGTNLGDRVENLANALTKLRELGKEQIKVVDTSFLYESEAMYHEEQNQFLNAAVKVRRISCSKDSDLADAECRTPGRDSFDAPCASRSVEASRSLPREGFLDVPERSPSHRLGPVALRRSHFREVERD